MFNFLDTELRGFIPSDNLTVCCAEEFIRLHLKVCSNLKILDLGCGKADMADFLSQFGLYVGCDIPYSNEARRRIRQDFPLVMYAGESLPFLDASFDCVVMLHVLEHIEKPYLVFNEIARVLKPGGVLIGVVSQMELYHSHSLWNVTPYGLYCLSKDAYLTVKELRPAVDYLSLTLGTIFSRLNYAFGRNRETLVNKIIRLAGKISGKSTARINAVQLFVAGQYYFVVKKENNGNK